MAADYLEYLLVLLLMAVAPGAAFPCSCGAPGPACAYVANTTVVFLGTPVYTNDDHSGTFVQQTLYRFEVEEIFKGLPEGTKEVWIDPGSFTSCYAEYELGTKLLVFASKGWAGLGDSPAVTMASPGKSHKPLPPGFDPKTPVYYAPECNGTRNAKSAGADVAWLRSWQHGETHARIYGEIHDEFHFPLNNVRVTATSGPTRLTATTGADGLWSLDNVRAGTYQLGAQLAQYRLNWNPEESVVAGACAYLSLPMEGSGAVSGTVVGSNHRPLAGIRLQIGKLSERNHLKVKYPWTETDPNGSFNFDQLPAGDYVVGVNLETLPSTSVPYERTYLPGASRLEDARVIHLEPGGTTSDLRVQMPPRMRMRTVRVRVRWADGHGVGKGVSVSADTAESGGSEFAETNADGVADLKCLAPLSYKISAQKWLSKLREFPARRAISRAERIEPGTELVSITLVLSKTVVGFKDDPE